ncbi:gem-associated protein 2-like [Amphibalanus amphitrite]|uniref:gem-associated protein 2-like n=1 Tax=Amphibalanus amphitrite TaxID=1232801 RepID=UPI001C92858D|nr:gem-associated protein 2-like [Amphibalanus amphitrite]XP_043192165.1 gem-associated protein 2-like [Amphibalanus amphitrite]
MSALRLRPSDDEGDGEESLLPRALEVPSGSEPEDGGGLPGSALQYLRYVRREQAKQSDVITASMAGLRIKATKPKAQPSPTPQEPAAAASGPSLSRQWQQTVESDFSGLRCRVARWKARHAPQLRRRAGQLPPAEDRDAWLAVCRQDADGGTVDTGLAPPSLLTIAACLQSQLLALLEHLLHWSRLQGLGDGRAAWLFAVMAALEKPLPADTCSCLREVARLCRSQRASLAKDDTRLAAACLLICLVGRYFGQVDLADPYR